MSDFKRNKSNMITPKGLESRNPQREKSSIRPPLKALQKPQEKSEDDLDKRIFGILSEKFITPFQDQFEKYEREMTEKIEKIQKDVERLDFQLNPKVDFTIDIQSFQQCLEEKENQMKKSESFLKPKTGLLTERKSTNVPNYSIVKPKRFSIHESEEFRNSMFFNTLSKNGEANDLGESQIKKDFCLLSLEREMDN